MWKVKEFVSEAKMYVGVDKKLKLDDKINAFIKENDIDDYSIGNPQMVYDSKRNNVYVYVLVKYLEP